jgi:ABC-type Fe3+/spermidine/putrescine transport system ATPase subunit
MVFQNYALFPHMTVAQNIAFPLRMRKMPKDMIDTEIKRVLQMVQLAEYEKRHPKQLSGGQQQRIALVRSLVFNPSVLLMDEPLGALDKKLREHVQTELKIIQKQLNITVIYVTHDQSEALNMSDIIAVLNQGKIEQIGSPRDLYESPANLFVADFIGESNFITGTVKTATEEYAIVLTGSGEEIKAPFNSLCSQGSEIVISAHPEKIVVLDDEDPNLNILRGRISEIIYLGEITKYSINVNGEQLYTKYHNRFDRRIHRVGDDVLVGWLPDDCKILK